MTKKYDSILLDIDNTITELQPTLDLMAKEFNREPVSAEDVLDFKLARAYNLTSEEEKSFWTGYEIELAERSELAVERVKNMLDTYTHEDTTIFVVTMRPQKSYEATFNWLRANNINFDTLICLGQASKVDYALHFGIEAIFEDNADLFEEVKRKELQDKQVLLQSKYQDEKDETMDFSDQVAAKRKLIKHYESLGCSRNQNVNTCTGMAAVDGWFYPLNSFYQSSNYGWDENRYHYAVDLAVGEGSAVKAVGNGEVIYSGVYWRKDGTSCGGLVIQIRHTYNGVDYISLYMHMLSSNVSVGKKVTGGQVIGYSGGGSQSIAKYNDQCTGGAHLHFTMAYAGKDGGIYNTSSSYQGTTFNPNRFFPAMKGIGSRYN